MPFPNRKVEDWHYVDTSPLKPELFDSQPALCEPKVDALASNVKSVQLTELEDNQIARIADDEIESARNDYFALSSLTQLNHATFWTFKPEKNEPTPLILTLQPDDEYLSSAYQIFEIQPNAKAKILLHLKSFDGDSLPGLSNFSFDLQENSTLEIGVLTEDAPQSIRLVNFNFRQREKSSLSAGWACGAGRFARFRVNDTLMGKGSKTALSGVSVLDSKNAMHHRILVNHPVPDCTSRQVFKNVLLEESKSSFDGTVQVDPPASGTNAEQLSQNLLLSPKARCSGKPWMKIFTRDVQCSHGATVGQLAPEEIFYLESRGIPAKTAKSLLAYGFLKEVSDGFPVEEFREEVDRRILDGYFDISGE